MEKLGLKLDFIWYVGIAGDLTYCASMLGPQHIHSWNCGNSSDQWLSSPQHNWGVMRNIMLPSVFGGMPDLTKFFHRIQKLMIHFLLASPQLSTHALLFHCIINIRKMITIVYVFITWLRNNPVTVEEIIPPVIPITAVTPLRNT